MTKPTLLALTSLQSEYMQQLETQYNIIRLYKETNPEGKLSEIKNDVTAILATMGNMVGSNLIEALPNLGCISCYSVGYDNVDINCAKDKDIIVTNTPDLVTDDTADTAIALMLAISRRISEGDAFIRVGKWENRNPFPKGRKVTGKKVGIVGLGRIGKAIARRCSAFDMHIAYHGRNKQTDVDYKYYGDLSEMAANVDYLILSCPGGEKTKYIVNQEIFMALGHNGFLVNVARGSVVNELDLVQALYNKTIAGAGLDVFENEPNVPDELKTLDNVVLLPHIGTATVETRNDMAELVVKNLLAYATGKAVLTPVTN
jgi:hydroxypyruvate reductase